MTVMVGKENKVDISENVLKASDGFELFYRRANPGKPRAAVIWLHGMNLHSGLYLGVMENFAQVGIMTLTPDLRGRGRSVDETWGRGDIHSLRRMVEDIKELRNAHEKEIDGKPVFIAGISFGALIAMIYAREHPKGVKGLLIGGPPFGHKSQATIAAMRIMANLRPNMAVKRAPRPEEVYENATYQERIRKDPLYNREPLRAKAASEIMQSLSDIEKNLGDVKIPLLLVYGSSDKLVTRKQLNVIKQSWGCEDCTIVLLYGIGHDVMNEMEVVEDIRNGKAKGVYITWVLNRLAHSK